MKKQEALTVTGLFTATGLMMIAMGFLSMPQDASLSFAQSWQQLWEQRPVFSWVMTVYFSMMFICDTWVAVGLLYDSRRPKRDSLKTNVARRRVGESSNPQESPADPENDLNFVENHS